MSWNVIITYFVRIKIRYSISKSSFFILNSFTKNNEQLYFQSVNSGSLFLGISARRKTIETLMNYPDRYTFEGGSFIRGWGKIFWGRETFKWRISIFKSLPATRYSWNRLSKEKINKTKQNKTKPNQILTIKQSYCI